MDYRVDSKYQFLIAVATHLVLNLLGGPFDVPVLMEEGSSGVGVGPGVVDFESSACKRSFLLLVFIVVYVNTSKFELFT